MVRAYKSQREVILFTILDQVEEQDASRTIHPAYNADDADIVLEASDHKQFRVHSVLLRLASHVFADVLSMPQGHNIGCSTVVHLTEDGEVVTALLDVIYPRRPQISLGTSDFTYRLATAADKYDLLDVTAKIRSAVLQSKFPGSAFDAYVLACKFGWYAEADHTSTATLSVPLYPNLTTAQTQLSLATMDGVSMLKLMNLHQSRKKSILDAFQIVYDWLEREVEVIVRRALAEHHGIIVVARGDGERSIKPNLRWATITASLSKACMNFIHSASNWAAIKYNVSMELDLFPHGERLLSADAFWASPGCRDVLQEKCNVCGHEFFSVDGIVNELKRIWDTFPSSISAVHLNSQLSSF